ncbi:MAG: hypothetical protein FWF77_01760 [Defluviitaleaceae bacterium]|nr:hypothetical protein [Defluviitaleaceae bacterium]
MSAAAHSLEAGSSLLAHEKNRQEERGRRIFNGELCVQRMSKIRRNV